MLTSEAQPPPIPATEGGLRLTILQRNVGQKWFGCMLTAAGEGSVPVSKRLKYFNAVVSSVACSDSGHRQSPTPSSLL